MRDLPLPSQPPGHLAASLFGKFVHEPGVHVLDPDTFGYCWHCCVTKTGDVVSIAAIDARVVNEDSKRALLDWLAVVDATLADRLRGDGIIPFVRPNPGHLPLIERHGETG